MGQQEVYDFLKKHKNGWFTARDISTQIGASIGSVTMCLKRLRETHFVDFRYKSERYTGGSNPHIYKFK